MFLNVIGLGSIFTLPVLSCPEHRAVSLHSEPKLSELVLSGNFKNLFLKFEWIAMLVCLHIMRLFCGFRCFSNLTGAVFAIALIPVCKSGQSYIARLNENNNLGI